MDIAKRLVDSLQSSWSARMRCAAVKFISKLNQFIFGRFDPVNIFLIIKINNFRGDLTDVSAKKEALTTVRASACCFKCNLQMKQRHQLAKLHDCAVCKALEC